MGKLIFACALAVASVACGRGCGYSDGERVGTVTKLSRKGVVCKTWEGEMVMGGLRSGAEGAVANVFYFSVDRPELVQPLQIALNSGRRVKITYYEGVFSGVCYGNSWHFVEAVEPLKE